MAYRKPRPRGPRQSAVDLAIAAVEGQPNAMDMPMAGFDPSPASLDLPEKEHREMCSRCGRPAVERCPECGSMLCGECVAGDED
jgi:hypothetical protein